LGKAKHGCKDTRRVLQRKLVDLVQEPLNLLGERAVHIIRETLEGITSVHELGWSNSHLGSRTMGDLCLEFVVWTEITDQLQYGLQEMPAGSKT
jgi:hypothetical protein